MSHAGFLQAILAAPDDDTPRLAYADWLEERGDPRGEFIRVQCELAQIGNPMSEAEDSRDDILRERERELLATHWPEWRPHRWCYCANMDGPDLAHDDDWWVATFRRGFVHSLTLPAAAWLEYADAILATNPVREVTLTTLPQVEQQTIGRVHDPSWRAPYRLLGRQRWYDWEALGRLENIEALGLKLLSLEWPGIRFALPQLERYGRLVQLPDDILTRDYTKEDMASMREAGARRAAELEQSIIEAIGIPSALIGTLRGANYSSTLAQQGRHGGERSDQADVGTPSVDDPPDDPTAYAAPDRGRTDRRPRQDRPPGNPFRRRRGTPRDA